MITAKLRQIVGRSAIALALAIGIGAATMSPAHAEWHNGQWGHWGYHNGVRVFIGAPYPYGYYPYPYAYPYPYYAPGPAYYAPPPVVVAPTFGFGFTVGGHH
jgi:hypothetical protein